ncbi:amidohydrolase 2 [Bimuria novae-zelandiae CBS 107.79]|uniref:Amidohydrolase 2 n=1 Tax=Bimuria novae-zelandiae CBS 107.79 TaxID=1447943 RepID=A0A6A5UT58_9PLEO|nr:amidohydrolase 2 [Bimuria novae-zelandiae CBS 107.79]
MASSSTCVDRIKARALRDDIGLSVLSFLDEALADISALSKNRSQSQLPPFNNAFRIDTHTHPVPSWFRSLQPFSAGRETPSWDPLSHLKFMDEHNITHSVLCVSTPQANAFPDDRAKTIALARLLNEFTAELVKVYPERFSWLAVTPLPYVEDTVAEVRYALEELGAVGVGVLTNHEGLYPGEESFDPLWTYLQERAEKGDGREIVFIHPHDPVIRLDDGSLVSSKPSPLRSGLGEFYFETARAISSITANRTIIKFQNLHWRISHGAGAFPDISDRFLLGFLKVAVEARKIYATRFWYDSAGPVYPRQIKGLLAHDVPISQMVFGTDYPYGIGFWDVNVNIAGLSEAAFLSASEKEEVFSKNAKALWQGKIRQPMRL